VLVSKACSQRAWPHATSGPTTARRCTGTTSSAARMGCQRSRRGSTRGARPPHRVSATARHITISHLTCHQYILCFILRLGYRKCHSSTSMYLMSSCLSLRYVSSVPSNSSTKPDAVLYLNSTVSLESKVDAGGGVQSVAVRSTCIYTLCSPHMIITPDRSWGIEQV
jgi:hypothetical protein